MDKKGKHRQIINQYGVLFVVVLIGIVLIPSNKNFLTTDNAINTSRQMAITAIVAIGMTFIMMTGDINVGASGVACLTGIAILLLMNKGINIPLALLAGSLAGAAPEFLNGALATGFVLPPMVVALGTMNLANGIASLLTGGTAVYGLLEGFLVIGRGSFLDVLNQAWLLAVFAIVSMMALNRTLFERHVYAIGDNAEVVKLSGIHVKKVKILLYIVSGICVSVGGIILSSRIGSGQPTLAAIMNMNVITVVAIGGTSLNGGSGTMRENTMGALSLIVITNGLNVNRINSYWQLVVSATVLIIAITMNQNDRLC